MLKEKQKIKLSFSNYSDEIYEIKNKTIRLQKQIKLWKEKAELIQSQFDFTLPNYIIDEIISKEHSKNYSNLHTLINATVINNKLTKENGNIIKKIY